MLESHWNSCMLYKFYVGVCLKHLVQVTFAHTGFSALRLDGVSAEWEGKQTIKFQQTRKQNATRIFQKCAMHTETTATLCGLKHPGLLSFRCWSTEAQARHSESTVRRCLRSSTRIHIAVFFGTPGTPINVNSQNQSRRVLATLSAHGNLQALHTAYVCP